jgi:Flp pilus assembly protein TadG
MISATNLWGIVIPGWIGALSGLVGSSVALASLLIARASDTRAHEATTRAARAEESERTTRSAMADAVRTLAADPALSADPGIRAAADPELARTQRREALQRVLARLEDPATGI